MPYSFIRASAIAITISFFCIDQQSHAEVLFEEHFNTNVLATADWSESDASVSVDIANGLLHIGTDGSVDDYVERQGPFQLPIVIEWRTRTVSGSGGFYSIPKLSLHSTTDGSNAKGITYVQDDQSGNPVDDGWLIGTWSDDHQLGVTGWNEWRTMRAIIRQDGGELYVKRDSDPAFAQVASSTWSLPVALLSLRFSQHTDDISDLDFIRVSTVEQSQVWCDGFENSNWGANWFGSGNVSGIAVDTAFKKSGNSSLKMFGQLSSCWGAVAAHPIDMNMPVEISYSVRNGTEHLNGCHPYRAALVIRTGGPNWFNCPCPTLMYFLADGSIKLEQSSTSPNVFGGFALETWHEVKCRLEVPGDGFMHVTFWINGQFLDSYTIVEESWMHEPAYVDISAQEGSVWFDDVCVEQMASGEFDECWSALGQGLDFNGANLTTYQGKLVAMGPFSEAGGVSTGGIATWNGTVWGSIGTGLNGQINNALEYNGKLYAVGNSNGVYVWDGSTWSTIPTDGWTQAITIYEGRLIVGGRFTMIDGVSASRVAAFDGSTWTSLGAGAVGGSPVTQLLNATAYNGKLYVGGIFDQMDGVSAKNVAAWDGTQWSNVGNGIDDEVGSLVVYDGKLIIGGYFNNFDTLTNVGHLVAWDGQNATRVGTGTQGVNAIAITVFDGRLVVTGAFSSAGGISANGVAFWDGEEWEALGSGVSGGFGGGAVVWEDNLYITGDFTNAGGKSASRIASWICRKPVPDSGSISGTISSNSEPLLGVSVSLINDLGSVVEEVQSNESGYYSFVSVVNGWYTVSILAPLGYTVAQEALGAVVNGSDVVVNFVCSIQISTPTPKSRAWWAHQAHLALNGKASLVSTQQFGTFGDQILAHFTENQLNPVTIYETSKFEAPATKLQAIKGLLSLVPVKGDEPFIRRLGRAQLMALMLNVVSGKIHQKAMVTKDSVNVSQVITYCDLLLNDLLPMPEDNGPGCGSELGRYIRADFILTLANLGVPVPAGLVPVSTLDIAYKQTGSTIPEVFGLHQNYPNPFNPETVIEFDLPESEAVTLEVINVLGQTVATLVHEELPAGSHRVTWDGRSGGREVSSGVYFYRLVTNSRVESRKMILLR